ncbi:zinc ribbon domain-containing protein [Alienimonas chondri]|uniref:Zinc ribbon domain-containing protein n=1 Tax=Alienimonas chondri TaxID=2681879 RepID=A0ABX1VFL8_9PLAN|nr:zinc ribbon domain-containing protein [Alienimonas chondri]NNJ26063.1 hypothetical protein [Alienimonas chondri]
MPEVAVESLLCQHCGAPLKVGRGAAFVTCAHCGASLRVVRSDSAAWTELAGELTERADRIEAKVDRLDRRTELADLDREWDRTRESLMVQGKHGHTSEPSVVGGVISGAVGLFGAAFALIVSAGAGFPAIIKIGFPIVFAGIGLFAAFSILSKADRWRREERRYRRRRAELLRPTQAAEDDA